MQSQPPSAESCEARFQEVALLPAPSDNCAVALRGLSAGSRLEHQGRVLTLANGVLPGHRFAVRTIAKDEALTSWGLAYGHALRDLQPGETVCNAKARAALLARGLPTLEKPNFRDLRLEHRLDLTRLQTSRQVEALPTPARFEGYDRGSERGAGTRNCIVVLGVTSQTGPLARAIADRFRPLSANDTFDGVVAVAHTEGGKSGAPHNLDKVLRTLSGFARNPNVGALLALDTGIGAISNEAMARHLRESGGEPSDLPHAFIAATKGFRATVEQASRQIQDWLPRVGAIRRTWQPLSRLRIGLQCGGSDAFSGISANPLAAIVARLTVQSGGSANLAETDELIGAEDYVLDKVRDLETARSFLRHLEVFETRARWHGHSAAGNPSAGNLIRGLYNITLKSLGAARKKAPELRLDYVIDYAAPMSDPGFYFMDSPGNDLESIAGQVASGCNLILFTTGNGSITNFPFVPTVKVMTNSERFRLLEREMDLNAGRYLEGEGLESLGEEAFEFVLRVASGQRTAGEGAGHHQVQLWRDWFQDQPLPEATSGESTASRPKPVDVRPEVSARSAPLPTQAVDPGYDHLGVVSLDGVGLILPTSLCSAEVARQFAQEVNATLASTDQTARFRCVALPHTEGCGVSGGPSEELMLRTLVGYLLHPSVRTALVLEHGCEKTHNDVFRERLRNAGVDPAQFGWTSIQLDGGLDKARQRVLGWFRKAQDRLEAKEAAGIPFTDLRLGLATFGHLPDGAGDSLADLVQTHLAARSTVVIAGCSSVWRGEGFRQRLLGSDGKPAPNLAYGDQPAKPGLYLMETVSDHAVETLTGLGAAGVHYLVVCPASPVAARHPMIPTLHVAFPETTGPGSGRDSTEAKDECDVWVPVRPVKAEERKAFVTMIADTLRRGESAWRLHHAQTDFQLSRGRYGVSL